jgi:hypothetical protein
LTDLRFVETPNFNYGAVLDVPKVIATGLHTKDIFLEVIMRVVRSRLGRRHEMSGQREGKDEVDATATDYCIEASTRGARNDCLLFNQGFFYLLQ